MPISDNYWLFISDIFYSLVQAFKYTLEEKSAKAKKLSEVEASIKPFIDNPQVSRKHIVFMSWPNWKVDLIVVKQKDNFPLKQWNK